MNKNSTQKIDFKKMFLGAITGVSRLVVSIVFVTLVSAVSAQGAGVGVSLDIDVIVGKRIQGAGRVYSAKFLCGTIPHDLSNPQLPPVGSPLVPGTYLTGVNIHNPYHTNTQFRKKALIANPQGKLPGLVGIPVSEVLGPNGGLEVDCQNIKDLLFGGGTVFVPSEPFFTGFVVVTAPPTRELDVTGVYTLKNVVMPYHYLTISHDTTFSGPIGPTGATGITGAAGSNP